MVKSGSHPGKHSAHVKKSHAKKDKRVGSKRQVLSGKRERTKGHLAKGDLIKNSRGKVVSKKKHAAGLKIFRTNPSFKRNALAIKKASATFRQHGHKPSFKQLHQLAKEIKKDM